MLVKNPKKHVITDYRIAGLLGLTKPDKKRNDFVSIGLEGKCQVCIKLGNFSMPVRDYSPTTNWADAGPVLNKYGKLLKEVVNLDLYDLPKVMFTITQLEHKNVTDYSITSLMFGKDWESNKELF